MDAGRVPGVGEGGGLPGGGRGWPSGLQMSGNEELGAMRQTLARDRVEELAPASLLQKCFCQYIFFRRLYMHVCIQVRYAQVLLRNYV